MAVQRYAEMKPDLIREGTDGTIGAERRLGYTDNLMMTTIDFYNGPQDEPDPPHTHSHEQISYVVDGEIFSSWKKNVNALDLAICSWCRRTSRTQFNC
jgi:quercetin dioxygenase-like cupin family protein